MSIAAPLLSTTSCLTCTIKVIFPYQYPVSVVTSPASACFLAFPSAASGGLGGSGQTGWQTNKQAVHHRKPGTIQL